MGTFASVAEARENKGIRLVLTAGTPGPWGEAAKGILHVKGIPCVRVRQDAGLGNDELVAWTGTRNAPQVVDENDACVSSWRGIIEWAEAHTPEPRLIPEDAGERERMFELLETLAGEGGFGWGRRLLLFSPIVAAAAQSEKPNPAFDPIVRMAKEYGHSPEAVDRASKQCANALNGLADQLRSQRARGSRYFIGDSLTALDIHSATFAALVQPLPDELCPLPGYLRKTYSELDETVAAAANGAPELLEHRDYIYREYLELPVVLG